MRAEEARALIISAALRRNWFVGYVGLLVISSFPGCQFYA
jgi:hypothetical protein